MAAPPLTPMDVVEDDHAFESGGVALPLADPSSHGSGGQSLHKKHDSLLQQPHYEGEEEGAGDV